jgi:hypothetical protein
VAVDMRRVRNGRIRAEHVQAVTVKAGAAVRCLIDRQAINIIICDLLFWFAGTDEEGLDAGHQIYRRRSARRT